MFQQQKTVTSFFFHETWQYWKAWKRKLRPHGGCPQCDSAHVEAVLNVGGWPQYDSAHIEHRLRAAGFSNGEQHHNILGPAGGAETEHTRRRCGDWRAQKRIFFILFCYVLCVMARGLKETKVLNGVCKGSLSPIKNSWCKQWWFLIFVILQNKHMDDILPAFSQCLTVALMAIWKF